MVIRLRFEKLSWYLKNSAFNTPKQFQSQKKCNSFLYVLCIAPLKRYIGIFHSGRRASTPISMTKTSIVPPTTIVKHVQKSKHARKPLKQSSTELEKSKTQPRVLAQNLKSFVLTHYINYVRNYEKILKTFPAALKLLRTFFDGMNYFYHDMKWYVKILRIVHRSPNGLRTLNLKELELYMKMPKDIIKVTPTIIGTSIPIIGYAFCTLVFMYPRQLLTTHFWTPQQREEFQCMQLRERLTNSNLIVCRLHRRLRTVKKSDQYELARILAIIEHKSTYFPTSEDLMNIRDIFAKPPYCLKSLTKRHIKLLCGLHDLPARFRTGQKLKKHALLIQLMDAAIQREGGVHNMALGTLEKACAIRGLNPDCMCRSDLVVWLEKWIAVTATIQEQHISLLLHLPIFLAFNHPNNWKLYSHAEGA